MCVSRPRRFGKSTAADMLAAYYGRNEDTSVLFEKLKISQEQSYQKHLNKYDVIKINMQEFLSMSESVEDMLSILQMRLIKDLKSAYPEVVSSDRLIFAMQDVFAETKCQFVILIDEWDCLFREYKQDKERKCTILRKSENHYIFCPVSSKILFNDYDMILRQSNVKNICLKCDEKVYIL